MRLILKKHWQVAKVIDLTWSRNKRKQFVCWETKQNYEKTDSVRQLQFFILWINSSFLKRCDILIRFMRLSFQSISFGCETPVILFLYQTDTLPFILTAFFFCFTWSLSFSKSSEIWSDYFTRSFKEIFHAQTTLYRHLTTTKGQQKLKDKWEFLILKD